MNKTANQILSIFENSESPQEITEIIIDELREATFLFLKKFKAVGATVSNERSEHVATIRSISVPSILHVSVDYDIFFPKMTLPEENKTINRLARIIKKNVAKTNLTKIKLSKNVYDSGKIISSGSSLEVYSSNQVNSFLKRFMIFLLRVVVMIPPGLNGKLRIRIDPAFILLVFDLNRLFRRDEVKDIEARQLIKLISDEILTVSDSLIRVLRLLDA